MFSPGWVRDVVRSQPSEICPQTGPHEPPLAGVCRVAGMMVRRRTRCATAGACCYLQRRVDTGQRARDGLDQLEGGRGIV